MIRRWTSQKVWVLFFIWGTLFDCAPVSSGCSYEFQQIGQTLPPGWRRLEGVVVMPIEEDKLMIGMQTKEKYGGFPFTHSYIVWRGKRFDGDPIRIRSPRSSSKNMVTDNSIIFEYKIDDPEIAKNLDEAFSKQNRFTFTCAEGNCSILKQAGLEPGMGTVSQLFPSRLMDKLLTAGLVSRDGKMLDFKVVQLGELPVERAINEGFPVEVGRAVTYMVFVGGAAYLICDAAD